ncbi:MAG: putative porin, partial [Cyclobacteriaceae bacterium]
MRNSLLKYFLILCVPIAGMHAQILDDSTRLVFGPQTVTVFSSDDVLFNRDSSLSTLDTSLTGIHWHKGRHGDARHQFQHLGNYASPQANIYYEAPTLLGKRMGYNSLDGYAFDQNNIQYFDTKSPLSGFDFHQTSTGQQFLDLIHTRNIGPQFNFGGV